jgi:hypothetical protein
MIDGEVKDCLLDLATDVYTGCIKKTATSEFPKKSLCNS